MNSDKEKLKKQPTIIKGPKAVIEEHRKLWQAVFTERLDKAERTKSEKESKYPVNHKVAQVTLLDFMEEIREGKGKTSPGPDMITNDIWKALPTDPNNSEEDSINMSLERKNHTGGESPG
jgi:hypothetical protein